MVLAVATAIALSGDPPRLAALRERLARQRASSGLFDMDGFARDFATLAAGLADGSSVRGGLR